MRLHQTWPGFCRFTLIKINVNDQPIEKVSQIEGRIACLMKVFHEMRGSQLEDIIVTIADTTNQTEDQSLSDFYSKATNQIVPVLQAFLNLTKTHKIPFRMVNIMNDFSKMRQSQYLPRIIVQKSIHTLLKTAYLESSRTWSSDLEYICVLGMNSSTQNDQYGSALLEILEQSEGAGTREVFIADYTRIIPDVSTTDKIAYAQNLYETMSITSKLPDIRKRRAEVIGETKFHVGIIKVYTQEELEHKKGHFRLEHGTECSMRTRDHDDYNCSSESDVEENDFTYNRRLKWSRGLTSQEVLDHKAQNVAKTVERRRTLTE